MVGGVREHARPHALRGADISELHKIGRLLEGKGAEDDEAWFDAGLRVADEVRGHAKRFRASRHPVSAAAFYLRACHYYQMASVSAPRRTARRSTPTAPGSTASISSWRSAIPRSRSSKCRSRVEKSLPSYFVHSQNATAARNPCVVFFDGLDVTKEIQYVAGVPDLIRRGISVLVMDGPGTGEAIRFARHGAAPRLREGR